MTSDELWRIILDQNPRFTEGQFPMTPRHLRKFFTLVWREAYRAGRGENLFGQLFGGGYGKR